MEYFDFFIRSTQQLVLLDAKGTKLLGFGSGVIIEYKTEKYLITVAHVTDYENSTIVLETGMREGQGSLPYVLDTIQYFDIYNVKEEFLLNKGQQINNLEDILNLDSSNTIDFAVTKFSPIETNFHVKQNKVDLGELGVVKGGYKTFLNNIDFSIKPDQDSYYCFYGTVKHEEDGIITNMQGRLEIDMIYVEECESFYVFKLTKAIPEPLDYQGTSGAPVFDNKGQFVGLVSRYYEDYPEYLFVISNSSIKTYLDIYITTSNQLSNER